jgi:hypothetical protein
MLGVQFFWPSKPSADRKPSSPSGLGTEYKSLKCLKWLVMARITTKALDVAHLYTLDWTSNVQHAQVVG